MQLTPLNFAAVVCQSLLVTSVTPASRRRRGSQGRCPLGCITICSCLVLRLNMHMRLVQFIFELCIRKRTVDLLRLLAAKKKLDLLRSQTVHSVQARPSGYNFLTNWYCTASPICKDKAAECWLAMTSENYTLHVPLRNPNQGPSAAVDYHRLYSCCSTPRVKTSAVMR